MAQSSEWQCLKNRIANPEQFVAVAIISSPMNSDIPTYAVLEYISFAQSNQFIHEQPNYTIPKWNIHKLSYSTIIYSDKVHGGKYSIREHLRALILQQSALKKINFVETNLSTIIRATSKDKLLFVKVMMDQCTQIVSNLFLILSIKLITKRSAGHTEILGHKLDIELLFNSDEWENLSIGQRIAIFAWSTQFGDAVRQIGWPLLSTTTAGYYYKPIYKKSGPLKLEPYIAYDPVNKTIKGVNLWLLANGHNIEKINLRIAHMMYLKVCSNSVARKIRFEYLHFVETGPSVGHHEKTIASNGNAKRRKSYFLKKYVYPAKHYKSQASEHKAKKSKIRFASTNVAAGLRIIDHEKPLPSFLVGLFTLFPMMPKQSYFDQIGIVFYQNTDSKSCKITSIGLGSHDEYEKFDDLWQFSAGKGTLLSFDSGGGDVNGTVGLDLPNCSMVHHDMKCYFHCGGKHSIARRHLLLGPGEWRITILFRKCVESVAQAALLHFLQCHNNDEYCLCLNRFLKKN